MPRSVKSSLLVAFRYLLKPLVRIAVRNGVSFPEFSNALKHSYVDVASRQITGAGNAVTAEGIFLITNIAAVQAEAMLQAPVESDTELDAQAQSPLPRLLNAWHTDQKYTGPYGVLRDLEFVRGPKKTPTFGGGEGSGFSDLAATYCPGISPKVLLDELIRTECVKDIGNGFFRAVSRSYVPDALSEENIRLIAQIVHNFCETVEFNVRPDSRVGKGLVQRLVYTRNGISAKNMDKLQAHVRARGQIFADEIDDWFAANQEPEESPGSVQTGVGFYHYVVNDEDERGFSLGLPTEGDSK